MPGVFGLLIVLGVIAVMAAFVYSAVARIRKKLSEDDANFWTVANEFGGYIVVGAIVVLAGVASLIAWLFGG